MRIAWSILFLASIGIVWFFLALPPRHAYARDGDDHGNRGPLKSWFDSLQSKRGMCCSFADGITIDDPDIDMDGTHYKVRIGNGWIIVPDDAVVVTPNRAGHAIVWPYKDSDGVIQIRCFLPGAGI